MRGDYRDIWAELRKLIARTGEDIVMAKERLAMEVSGGRTTSLRELSREDLSDLREGLRQATGSTPTPTRKGSPSRRRARSRVLHLLEDYGIDTGDWAAINAFCRDKRIAGQDFGRLTEEELGALARKLHAIIRKREEGPFVERHKGPLRLDGDRPRRQVKRLKRRPRYISSGQLTGATAMEINININ